VRRERVAKTILSGTVSPGSTARFTKYRIVNRDAFATADSSR
jgi:hypothetical protein